MTVVRIARNAAVCSDVFWTCALLLLHSRTAHRPLRGAYRDGRHRARVCVQMGCEVSEIKTITKAEIEQCEETLRRLVAITPVASDADDAEDTAHRALFHHGLQSAIAVVTFARKALEGSDE